MIRPWRMGSGAWQGLQAAHLVGVGIGGPIAAHVGGEIMNRDIRKGEQQVFRLVADKCVVRIWAACDLRTATNGIPPHEADCPTHHYQAVQITMPLTCDPLPFSLRPQSTDSFDLERAIYCA